MKEDTINKFRLPSFFLGLIPLFVLAHFSHHVMTALAMPLLPFIRNEFALDYTLSGWVISAFSLSYGICQLPAGWLADRVGARLMIAIGISGVALFGVLVGLSQTYLMMIVFIVLMGVAGGSYHPAASTLISAATKSRSRGQALGIHIIGGSASNFLTPLIGVAIAAVWGWRGSYIVLAFPTLVFGIILYGILGRRLNNDNGTREISLDYYDGQGLPAKGRVGRLVAFVTVSTFNEAVSVSVVAFIPLFMVDYYGVSKEIAASSLAIIHSAGFWASPLGGYLSDRFGGVPVILAICFLAGPILYIMTLVPYGLGLGILLLAIGVTIKMRMPIAESYIISQTQERHRSTVLGIYFFSGLEGGGVLTPVLGLLIDRLGFYHSFTIAGIALFVVTSICAVYILASLNQR